MKHLPADKYNIAWFKLAEFVARKEKERALGIYRLLVHSLDDRAVASQLEGDLLLCFNDLRAIDSYLKAAHVYEKELRIAQAAAVYEHIVLLNPEELQHLSAVTILYLKLDNQVKATEHALNFINNCIVQQAHGLLESFFNNLQEFKNLSCITEFYIATVFALLRHQPTAPEIITYYIEQTVNQAVKHGNRTQLQQFLSKLALLHEEYHKTALALLSPESELF